MSLSFVHLSDIHFGQEKTMGVKITHDDAKACLIADARRQTKDMDITGIIVTGDVAYAGKREEFQQAGVWLDDLAAAVRCPKTEVQVVPGNHDIDRDHISDGTLLMIYKVLVEGEDKLDGFLQNTDDCEALYRKLSAYWSFAEGYNCFLDKAGGIASNKIFTLAPGRTLRFVGLNSALLCYAKEKEGHLVLGARQRVLSNNEGEELVVLCHHPLNWFQDSKIARNYIKNRARVLMTGHEHKPSMSIDNVRDGRDIMYLASGAAVPPEANEKYRYTYNIITFDWDKDDEALTVTIRPRTWSEGDVDFVDDTELLGGDGPTFKLASPNYRAAAETEGLGPAAVAPAVKEADEATAPDDIVIVEESTVPERFALVLLRFFRDLTPAKRLEIFVKLEALPPNWTGGMNQAMERMIVDKLVRDGRIAQLEEEIGRSTGRAAEN
jgi:calcineurin-like phosphoesterase family protein